MNLSRLLCRLQQTLVKIYKSWWNYPTDSIKLIGQHNWSWRCWSTFGSIASASLCFYSSIRQENTTHRYKLVQRHCGLGMWYCWQRSPVSSLTEHPHWYWFLLDNDYAGQFYHWENTLQTSHKPLMPQRKPALSLRLKSESFVQFQHNSNKTAIVTLYHTTSVSWLAVL